MNTESSNVGGIPTGQLQSLKSIFEAGVNQVSNSKGFGVSLVNKGFGVSLVNKRFGISLFNSTYKTVVADCIIASNAFEKQFSPSDSKHMQFPVVVKTTSECGPQLSNACVASGKPSSAQILLSPSQLQKIQTGVTLSDDTALSVRQRICQLEKPHTFTNNAEVCQVELQPRKRHDDDGSSASHHTFINDCNDVHDYVVGASESHPNCVTSEQLFERLMAINVTSDVVDSKASGYTNIVDSTCRSGLMSRKSFKCKTYDIPWDINPLLKGLQIGKVPFTTTSCTDDAHETGCQHGVVDELFVRHASMPSFFNKSNRPPLKPPRTHSHRRIIDRKFIEKQYEEHSQASQSLQSACLDKAVDRQRRRPDDCQSNVVAGKNCRLFFQSLEAGNADCEVNGIRENPPSQHVFPTATMKPALKRRNVGSEFDSSCPYGDSMTVEHQLRQRSLIQSIANSNVDQLSDPVSDGDLVCRYSLRRSLSFQCLNDIVSSSDSSMVDYMLSSVNDSICKPVCMEKRFDVQVDDDGYAIPFMGSSNMTDDSNIGGVDVPPNIPSTVPAKVLHNLTNFTHGTGEIKNRPRIWILEYVFRRHPDTPHYNDRVNAMTTDASCDPGDADDTMDVGEIARRVSHCSSVRQNSLSHLKVDHAENLQLFNCAFIVGLSLKCDRPAYEPDIMYRFPPTTTFSFLLERFGKVSVDPSVPMFCFPDVDQFIDEVCSSTATAIRGTFSFVMTDLEGRRAYCHCRRFQPPDTSLPEAACLVSFVEAFSMYNKLLIEVERLRMRSMDLAQELLAASFGRPLPQPGHVCHVRIVSDAGEMESIFLERPADHITPCVNYECLLHYFGTDMLIAIFSSMLMERRLIFCSNYLSILTQTVHAVKALLYPFQWHHVYMPLIPGGMLGVCAATTPFIVGVLRRHMKEVARLELEDVLIVDLDRRLAMRTVGDEHTLLPAKLHKALKTAIGVCRTDCEPSSQWLMTMEAFLRLFLETIGHYAQHIIYLPDGSKSFLRDEFVAGAPSKAISHFLQWFSETQMFEMFISRQLGIGPLTSMDLFKSRLCEYQAMKRSEASRQLRLREKVRNLGKAIKSKLSEVK